MNKKIILLTLVLFLTTISFGYEPNDSKQFLKILPLLELVKKAQEAGFSEEEINGLLIKDGQTIIRVENVIESIKSIDDALNYNKQLINDELQILIEDNKATLDYFLKKTTVDKTPVIFLSSIDVYIESEKNQKKILEEILQTTKNNLY